MEPTPDLFFISQVLVGVAFLFDLLSFQFRDRRHILFSLFVSCSLVSIHFWLLANNTAAALFFLIAIRLFVSVYSTSSILMIVFMLLGAGLTALTYEHPVNLLALAGSTLGTYASFRKDDRSLRLLLMVATLFLIAHNVVTRTPAAALLEGFFLVSNLIGYYRYYLRGPAVLRPVNEAL